MKNISILFEILLLIGLILGLNACGDSISASNPSTSTILFTSLPSTHTPITSTTATKVPTPSQLNQPEVLVLEETELATNKPQSTPNSTPTAPSATALPPNILTYQPNETSDLLFIAEGNLNRWDYVTGYSGLLVENVTEFFSSADGKRIVLLRPHTMTVNGISIYDLDLLDFNSKQTYTVLEEIPHWDHISMSPDGNWLAYISKDNGDKFYVLNIDQPEQNIELGTCLETEFAGCGFASWSPDSREVVWSDAYGAWHANLYEQTNHQIHSEIVKLTDPKGAEISIEVHFQELFWSPIGRYVLTKVMPNDSGISWYGVIDSANGRLVRVPDTFNPCEKIASVRWATDGSLLIAHVGGTTEQPLPFVKRWSLVATHDDLLIPHSEFQFSAETPANASEKNNTNATTCITWITHSDHLYYMLNFSSQDPLSSSSILTLDLEEGLFSKLVELEQNSEQVLLSPDNSGALIFGPRAQIQFLDLSSGNLLDLHSILGSDASSFHWMPPAPRT